MQLGRRGTRGHRLAAYQPVRDGVAGIRQDRDMPQPSASASLIFAAVSEVPPGERRGHQMSAKTLPNRCANGGVGEALNPASTSALPRIYVAVAVAVAVAQPRHCGYRGNPPAAGRNSETDPLQHSCLRFSASVYVVDPGSLLRGSPRLVPEPARIHHGVQRAPDWEFVAVLDRRAAESRTPRPRSGRRG